MLRSIECSDPKLLATIAQAESDKNLKSDLEAMASFVLPSDPTDNNKAATPNKDTGSTSDAKADASSVGGRDRSTEVDLRFRERAECLNLSKQAKETLRRWRSSNPEAFDKSKRKVLGPNDPDTYPNKCQKTGQEKKGSRLNDIEVTQI